MKAKRAALIACSNGYGHIRRQIILSKALSEFHVEPILFAPIDAVRRISLAEGVEPPETISFNSKTKISNWLDGSAENWYRQLPDLSTFDIVISDNLIEILKVRPDAWLFGSFFWHESLKDFPVGLKERSRELLVKIRPRMISSQLFITEEIRSFAQVHEVGLFSSHPSSYTMKSSHRNSALISCGKGGLAAVEAKEFVGSLAQTQSMVYETVWVESSLIPDRKPSWMLQATFNRKMYEDILVAVVRPGVGTVSNAIISGARVFTFYEPKNKEMAHNANSIQKSSLGIDTSLISDAWKNAQLYAVNRSEQKGHFKKVKSININGAMDAVKIILETL